jgi:thioredoxin 1
MKGKFNDLISSSKPVLVDFSAEWCGPCKMMTPVLSQLKEKLGDRIRIIKIDVDRNPDIASEYRIQSVPSLILFQNGSVVWSGAGVMPASHLENIIQKSCAA